MYLRNLVLWAAKIFSKKWKQFFIYTIATASLPHVAPSCSLKVRSPLFRFFGRYLSGVFLVFLVVVVIIIIIKALQHTSAKVSMEQARVCRASLYSAVYIIYICISISNVLKYISHLTSTSWAYSMLEGIKAM